jgi:alpha-1,3-fucosyltransferase
MIREPVKILYWTPFYTDKKWYGYGSAPFRNCEYSSCTATSDKQEQNTSDVILIHMRSIKAPEFLPGWRSPDQAWVMYTHESPAHSVIPYAPFNHVFNASMTYKNVSDIYLPSIQFQRRQQQQEQDPGDSLSPRGPGSDGRMTTNYSAGKSRLVAWFVSNCKTQSRRERYVAQLQRYIDIDIYGNCGSLKCPKQRLSGRPKSHINFCDRQLKRNYKFYLSFENSLCVEYFTEKVSRAYSLNVVPVVLGKARYNKLLPPNSYINVRDFSSPKRLAEYLKTVDKNDTLYNEYFAWKDSYEIVHVEPQCKLCEFAHK